MAAPSKASAAPAAGATPRGAASPTGSTAAITVADLCKSYPGRGRGARPVPALAGIGFTVPAGTVFGLLGPNGAGKSTTVKILSTLSRADSGTASVAGYDVRRDPGLVRRSIGLVTQKSGTDLDATGRENLWLQGRLYGLGGTRLTRRVDELLDRFDLGAAADRLARTYSGGMLRRLDVAVGLVHRPSVLFLDEPTTGLDPQARSAMWREIADLTADGLTILLTTHYLEEADHLAARVAIVEGGRVVVEGSPDTLRSELRGDSVNLELAAHPEGDRTHEGAEQAARVRELLAAVPGVLDVAVEGRQVRSRVSGGAATLPAVIAALDGAGLAVASATIARPSLDDVYLRHVGRRMRPEARSGDPDAAANPPDTPPTPDTPRTPGTAGQSGTAGEHGSGTGQGDVR
ncbi:daunorubicin resistance ABC transporter ATPase subunit [Parafrankia sp. EAN1pec]|uniref:ATP-binding cassette domain-containing protein n=1 Tax=Parafrankia sp. (strain EAN1pec) TaxID=298653 RepID=UPI0000540BC3|nr:daunorubicin resistance ABC transporter ATPase subunit [Frankia sp. EAN1pec]